MKGYMEPEMQINPDEEAVAGESGNDAAGDAVENQTTRELADEIFDHLDQKKARDLKLIDLAGVNSYFGLFLLATANSQMHLKSLVRDISKTFGARMPAGGAGMRPDDPESGWAVIDFIDLVVHVFLTEQRSFYNLERLWGDAPVLRSSPGEAVGGAGDEPLFETDVSTDAES